MHAPILAAVTASSAFGAVVASIIRSRKNKNICLPGEKCENVLSSRYSDFFGIPMETIGLAYYAALAIISFAGTLLVGANLLSPEMLNALAFILLGFTGAGFAMSCYLTFIQATYLHSWCSWCIRSAFAATLAFLFAWLFYLVSDATMLPILRAYQELLDIVHISALALALVAATVSDLVIISFIRTFSTSEKAERVFRYATQTSMSLLFVVILTYIGLAFVESYTLTPHWNVLFAQGISVLIVTANVAFLNLFVSPYVYDMVTNKTVCVSKVLIFRRIAFVLAATSFISWYTAFALTIYPNIQYSIRTITVAYVAAIIGAVIIGLLFEALSSSIAQKKTV